jgi:putative membrane protein
MRRLVSTFCVIVFGTAMPLIAVAQAGANETGNTSGKQSAGIGDTDSTFVKKAAAGELAEVELGQLAAQKASSEEVKKFGQRMVDDHSKANEQLKQVAAEKNINVPQQLNAKDKATKAHLEKLAGEQFDKAYMRVMVKEHQKDVTEFERASTMVKDPAIKNFVEQTLPTLKDHLNEAEKIAPKQQQAEHTSGL